jgi:hypothetical protein
VLFSGAIRSQKRGENSEFFVFALKIIFNVSKDFILLNILVLLKSKMFPFSSWKECYKTAKIISLKKSFMSKKWIAFSRSMPWLCFDESGDGPSLFYSQAGSIFKTTPLQCPSKPSIFSNFSEKNVGNKFAVDGGLIFGGSMGGSALLWNSQSKRVNLICFEYGHLKNKLIHREKLCSLSSFHNSNKAICSKCHLFRKCVK